MRTLLVLPFMLAWAIPTVALTPADSTGLAGDQFNLEAALEMFRQAKDLNDFERALNTADNRVSNLDLDGNGEVDYVHVSTKAEGEARVVMLRVALGKEETQDIAAIAMERDGEGMVKLQIIGDESLYPDSTLVEPVQEVKDGERKGKGPMAPSAQVMVWVNVWSWPCVQWCYGTGWWGWSSGWYWGFYPPWWSPWRIWGWNDWWYWSRPYAGWYRPVHVCRVMRARHLFHMHRASVVRLQGHRGIRAVRPRMKDEVKHPDRGLDRTRQPERVKVPSRKPERAPDTKPQRKPSGRTAPSRPSQPSRQSPSRSPAPRKEPGRSPGKR